MAKSRQAPALFEVIKTQDKAQPPAAANESVMEPNPQAPMDKPSAPEVVASSPEAPTPDATDTTASEWLVTEGDQLRFTLSTTVLATIIFAIVGLLLLSFWIGRISGNNLTRDEVLQSAKPATSDEFAELRNQEAQPALFEELERVNPAVQAEHEQSLAAAQGTTGQPVWRKGLNYIWVDTFRSENDALKAKQWLALDGITTEVVRKQDRWRLYTTSGFDYRIPRQKQSCTQLADKIKQLGEAYLKAGGRYRFDCQITKLKNETW